VSPGGHIYLGSLPCARREGKVLGQVQELPLSCNEEVVLKVGELLMQPVTRRLYLICEFSRVLAGSLGCCKGLGLGGTSAL